MPLAAHIQMYNFRLGSKDLSDTNTLAYFWKEVINSNSKYPHYKMAVRVVCEY
jgi:hypothetical protein